MTFEEYLSPLSVKPTTDLLIKKANEWQAENLKRIEYQERVIDGLRNSENELQKELYIKEQRISELEAENVKNTAIEVAKMKQHNQRIDMLESYLEIKQKNIEHRNRTIEQQDKRVAELEAFVTEVAENTVPERFQVDHVGHSVLLGISQKAKELLK
jgi:hypothetical protein